MNKIVDFTWCNSCKHKSKEEYENPCHDCLNEPGREDSRRPEKYEKDEDKS